MTTPPVPQWAVDAAKALDLAEEDAMNCDRGRPSYQDLARIIAAHAPRSQSQGQAEDAVAALEGFLTFHSGHVHLPEVAVLVKRGYAAIHAARTKDL